MRWLVFGTYEAQRHPRVSVLIEGLRAAGDEVVEVNVPLGLDTASRVALLRQPWRLPLLVGKLARCWTLLVSRARRWRTPGAVDVIVVGYLGHFDVRLARWLFPRTPIVLDHLASAAGTARDRGLAGGAGVKARLMRAIDAGALRAADLVVVDTDEHAAALPSFVARPEPEVAAPVARPASEAPAILGRPSRGDPPPVPRSSVVAPVGAGADWFAHRPAVRPPLDGRPIRAVFVGLYTPLHGTTTLGAALAALAADHRIEVTMVGTGQEYAACRAAAADNPRVRWIDWVRAEDLPDLVAAHDVALGIFGTTAKALDVVPTKVFQGAAAGCAVLTSDTAPQRRILGDAAVFVPPGNPVAIAAALREFAAHPRRLAESQAAVAVRADERFRATAVVAPIRRWASTGARGATTPSVESRNSVR